MELFTAATGLATSLGQSDTAATWANRRARGAVASRTAGRLGMWQLHRWAAKSARIVTYRSKDDAGRTLKGIQEEAS